MSDDMYWQVSLLSEIRGLRGDLRRLLTEIRGLRGNLQRPIGPPVADDAMAELIHEIDMAMPNRVFAAAEVISLSALNEPLRKALDRICQRDARRLGKALQRLQGRATDRGLAIARVGGDRDGAIWAVISCGSHSHHSHSVRCHESIA